MSKKEELTSKSDHIKEMIAGQKKFIQEVNEHGYEEREYWMDQTEYRKRQEELAKNIHNAAHKQYLGEYTSKSVVADITAGGGWLSEEKKDK